MDAWAAGRRATTTADRMPGGARGRRLKVGVERCVHLDDVGTFGDVA